MRSITLSALPMLCLGQIRILSPINLEQDPLFDKGIIYGTTAIFGPPEYGKRTLGEVVYFPPSANHCEDSDFEKYPSRDDTSRADDMKIFVVDRGGCPFEEKVRHAQARGAGAVIIIDFPCSKQRELALADGHPDLPCRDSEAVQRIVMADTSGARDIHIPSILIARAEGERLLGAVKKTTGETPSTTDDQVVVMLLWDIPRSDYVSVDFWMSSAATDTSYFMAQFAPFATELGPLLKFSPHFSLSQMSRSQVYKSSSCLASTLPSGSETFFCDSHLSSSGENIVREDARQLCIWHATAIHERSSESNKLVSYSPKYWGYMAEFYQTCHPSRNKGLTNPFNDKCAETVMKNNGIESNSVNWCIENMKPPQCMSLNPNAPECAASFHLLQDQATHQAWSPHALRINGWRYSGPLEATVVLKTICQGFVDVPDICYEVPLLGGSYLPFQKLNSVMVWFIVLSMGGLVATAFWMYRRNLKHTLRNVLREEVMLEVRSQMADYAMLAEDEESAAGKPRNNLLEMTRFTPQQVAYAPMRPSE